MQSVVAWLAEQGCMVDPDALNHIVRQSDPDGYVRQILPAFLELPFQLTLPALLSAEAAVASPAPVAPPLEEGVRLPLASEHDADVRVLLQEEDEAPVGELQDFVDYFNDRFDTLGKLLRRRREVANAVPINRAKNAGREVQLIGLVADVSKSNKSGHRFIDLEDATGQTTILVHAGRGDLVGLADSLMQDEVVGVVAKASKDGQLLVAESIIRPDLPFRTETRAPLDVPLQAAVLSDIHVGSKTFLASAFRRFAKWMHGEEGTARERAVAKSIKYLVLPGDVVDGVGIFPGQEHELEIPEVLGQYRQLARELEALPSHVHIVLQPGNHDASRPTEPQPALNKEIRGYFDSMDTTFITNPAAFTLSGRRVLSYHGFSMIDFVQHVPGLSLERPTQIMQHMLQCRHLAPAYGGKTPVAPFRKDRLVIGTEPDLFITGHVHVVGLDRYRGVTLVNGGAWQAQTSYQKMLNLTPTPAVMPVINLSTLNATKVEFGGPG